MASRYRSLSKPTISLLKSTIAKPSLKPKPASSLLNTPSSLTLSRSVPRLGSLQSLLPLHTAVSSARLTSCLGPDSRNSRSLSQGHHQLTMAELGGLGTGNLIGESLPFLLQSPDFRLFLSKKQNSN